MIHSFLTTSVFHPFGWTSPFTRNVWLAIAVTLVVTAMICLFVEGSAANGGINAPFKSSMISVSFSYIHQVFLNATGHLDIIPRTRMLDRWFPSPCHSLQCCYLHLIQQTWPAFL